MNKITNDIIENIKTYLFRLFRQDTQRSLLLNAILLVLIVFCVTSYIFYSYLPNITKHAKTLTIPILVNQPLDKGITLLNDLGLRHEIIDTVYDGRNPMGTIVRQNPPALQQVKTNRKIYLTINTNISPKIGVPNILYSSLKNAKLLLEAKGLFVGKTTYVPDLAKNAVLKVIIDGREINDKDILSTYTIKKGSVIDLVLGDGLGEQNIQMPNLIGIPLDEVEVILLGLGLQIGNIEYVKAQNKYQKIGQIVGQFPEAGHIVKMATLIQIHVVEHVPKIINENN